MQALPVDTPLGYTYSSLSENDEEIARIGYYISTDPWDVAVDTCIIVFSCLELGDLYSLKDLLENMKGGRGMIVFTQSESIQDMEWVDTLQQLLRILCLDKISLHFLDSKNESLERFKACLYYTLGLSGEVPKPCLDKETLFMPADWDSITKIRLVGDIETDVFLSDGIEWDAVTQVFNDIVPLKKEEEAIIVKKLDGQVFLKECVDVLRQEPGTPMREENERDVSSPVSAKIKSPGTKELLAGGQNEVLANFFQSLLNKKK